MHHVNGKLLVAAAAAAPNHTPPYESTIQSKSPEYGGSSNGGDLYNDWGAKLSGLVASERANVVTIGREGTVDNKPCIVDPRLGFNNDSGNSPHPNNGLNNGNGGFPLNGMYNHNDEGPQNDRNNNFNGMYNHLSLMIMDLGMAPRLVALTLYGRRSCYRSRL